ncbi:MAG: DUF4332 domain-containing protein, partial [bacterium]
PDASMLTGNRLVTGNSGQHATESTQVMSYQIEEIQGIGPSYPENLATRMKEVNDDRKLAKTSPAATVVEGWVAQAKSIDPKITYRSNCWSVLVRGAQKIWPGIRVLAIVAPALTCMHLTEPPIPERS